ncbi:hypothetical protein [Corallococcus carmarthensis]|uniref:hypothetical protein n=1 Tax=Corallococcus carmarthensis TaxID=2316728 RepID=UPI0011C467FF|nr:hypothetical protein [Corallococcus carmarthensis]
MNIVISYDLDSHHTAVKNLACANGFSDQVMTTAGWKTLPNTTLIGDFPSAKDAADAFKRLAKTAAPYVKVEKVLACPMGVAWVTNE